jgi:hypothetical protein
MDSCTASRASSLHAGPPSTTQLTTEDTHRLATQWTNLNVSKRGACLSFHNRPRCGARVLCCWRRRRLERTFESLRAGNDGPELFDLGIQLPG